MIRAFDWRDLPLLRRIRNRGLCLDSRLSYTRGPNVLQYALLDALNPVRSASTLVARPASSADGEPALAQYFYHGDDPNAYLAYVSPSEVLDGPNADELLEALARSAGERGAHNLIAEVDESLLAFESLRRAGFAIYARQRIWTLSTAAAEPGDGAASGLPAQWRPEVASDETPISSLYLNLVPALVQQVEQPPQPNAHNLVYWQTGEMLGYLNIDRGPLGLWIQPYFHPAAEHADRLLAGFLAQLEPQRRGRPLYVCVRSYQSWMGASLQSLGFECCCDQAVMVKRLTAGVRQMSPSLIPALEGAVKTTSPLAHVDNAETPTKISTTL